jgi:thiol-disulfide isomerase/thioredoxin
MNREVVRTSRSPAWRVLLSGALGFAALLMVIASFIVMQNNQDIRPVLIVTYCAFVAAGFCSPQPAETFNWVGAIAVPLGGILPGLALHMSHLALTDSLLAALLTGMAIAGAFMGLVGRQFMSRRRVLLAGAVNGAAFVLAVAAAFIVVPQVLDRNAYLDVDRDIAPFSVRTLDGEPISSDTWRGRTVVLSYWATWCPPCLAEIPEVSALQKKYKHDPRIAIVMLNAGYGGDTPQKAREFLDRRHFEVTSDIDDIKVTGRKQGEAAVSLGLKGVPTLFILNKDQRLVAVHAGFDGSEHLATTLSNRIDSLVNVPP